MYMHVHAAIIEQLLFKYVGSTMCVLCMCISDKQACSYYYITYVIVRTCLVAYTHNYKHVLIYKGNGDVKAFPLDLHSIVRRARRS